MKDSSTHFRFVYFITQFQVSPFFFLVFVWRRDGGKIKGELAAERSWHYGSTTFSHIEKAQARGERRKRKEKEDEEGSNIGTGLFFSLKHSNTTQQRHWSIY